MGKFSFGSDPEFMLLDSNGVHRSAIGVVLGSSNNRINVDGNEFYQDNVNVEMAILPGWSKQEVIDNFQKAFKTCSKIVRPFLMDPRAAADFLPEELEHPKAKEIGCEPEFSAYTLDKLYKPEEEFASGTLRTAGGHVHLGAKSGCLRKGTGFIFVVRCLDIFLGVPSLFMDHDPTSPRRKSLYGVAGSHRHKPYGVEYRALGNFWLSSPKLVSLVYDICEFTIDFVQKGKYENFWKIDSEKIEEGYSYHECVSPVNGFDEEGMRSSFDKGDKEKASQFLAYSKKYMPKDLYGSVEKSFNPVQYNFYEEWNL